MADLEPKMLSELGSDAHIIACRFPLERLRPVAEIGVGIDTVWLYRTVDENKPTEGTWVNQQLN